MLKVFWCITFLNNQRWPLTRRFTGGMPLPMKRLKLVLISGFFLLTLFSSLSFAIPRESTILNTYQALSAAFEAEDSAAALKSMKKLVKIFGEASEERYGALQKGFDAVFGGYFHKGSSENRDFAMNRSASIVFELNIKDATVPMSIRSDKTVLEKWRQKISALWSKQQSAITSMHFNEDEYIGHNDWDFFTVTAKLKNREMWTDTLALETAKLLAFESILTPLQRHYVSAAVLLGLKDLEKLELVAEGPRKLLADAMIYAPGDHACKQDILLDSTKPSKNK